MTYPGFVFRVLSKAGYDPEHLLANTGLKEADFADPRFLTDLPPLRRFFLNAIEQTGEPHLGIRLAQQFEASFIGLPAYAAMNAPTFKDALAVLSRYFFLAFPAIEFSFLDEDAEVQPGEFAIRLRPQLPMGDIAYFASVSALVGCAGLCEAILRTPKAALRGEMSVGKPEGWAEVEDQIGFPIRFDAADIRLFMAKELLTKELPGADPLNHPRLISLCKSASVFALVETTPLVKVARFLQIGQNLAMPVSQVAAAMGHSERSLRRHLEQSGTTYRQLTNEIREQKARELLANTNIPIQTIASELGFESSSNFARSFKRWTGQSPTDFRLAQNDDDGHGQI
jgi:AraC-like DNA-binding protein